MSDARILVNGAADQCVSALDRGLTYGDGVFETILLRDGQAPHWPRHWSRLVQGCQRLRLPLPDMVQLETEMHTVCLGLTNAVARITITRGRAARGYAISDEATPTRIVAGFFLPAVVPDDYRLGIELRWCSLRLGMNKDLAGIKHLNRLEQVLARAEWNDPRVREGLLCDHQGNVISATAANLFLTVDGRLVTPQLDSCGVAGVARAAVLELLPECTIRSVRPEEVMQADELFLTSSVRGIVPVAKLDSQHFLPGPVAQQLQGVWRDQGWLAH